MEPRRIGLTVDGGAGVVIAAALREEVAPLIARLENRSTVSLDADAGSGVPFVTRGRLGDRPISILVTGDGAPRARQGVRSLLERSPVDRLLVVGVAGGLSPDLEPAELVVGQQIVRADGSRFVQAPDEAERTARLTGARLGTVVSASALALSSTEKRRVRETLAPVEDACVVDLETGEFVAAAERAGVEWAVIRAVSDTASEDLPGFLDACAGPDGEIRRSVVLRHAASHPWVIPSLLRLRGRLERCALSLSEAVVSWVPGVARETLSMAAG